MKRNKNGMTIVEILVSILIIGLVITFLFNMLIQVRNEDVENNIQSNFLLNQASFIKAIEEDVVSYGVKRVSSCTLSEAKVNVELINNGYENLYNCVRIDYDADYTNDNIGFLMIYNTYAKYDVKDNKYVGVKDTSTWMIQYIRGHYKYDKTHNLIGSSTYNFNDPDISSWVSITEQTREYPKNIEISYKPYILYTAAPSSVIGGGINTYNAANLVMPIVNPEGEHFDIDIAFTFNGNDKFKCSKKDPNKFECRCKTSEELCNITYEY